MKVNRGNLRHWQWLFCSGLNVFLAVLLRPLCRPFLFKTKPLILLYGHKLNGNLLNIYQAYQRDNFGLEIKVASMDRGYIDVLSEQQVGSIDLNHPKAISALIRTKVIVSDHGLHWLILLRKFSSIKFVDVWHGIPFKGFDAEDFAVQRQYDAVIVPSKRLADLYAEKFGFKANILQPLGYARTDTLVRPLDVESTKEKLGLPEERKVVTFAPTWQQDSNARSIFPFESSEEQFLGRLNKLAKEHDFTAVLRTHLNSKAPTSLDELKYVMAMPSDVFVNTEELLAVSDVLVCDWSSIAFDFLLLQRPTVFLDVPAPFKKGFSLGPEYRFGEIVKSLDDLFSYLSLVVDDPTIYERSHHEKALQISNELYEDYADGHASKRALELIAKLAES